MSDPVFTLRLDDKISGPAETAAASLASLQTAIKSDEKQLAQLNAAMKRIQSAGTVDVAVFRQLKGQIDATKQSIAKNQSAFVAMGGKFGEAPKKAEPAAKATKSIAETMAELPGPIGNAGSAIGVLAKRVGASGLAMLGAAGVAAGLAVAITSVASAAVSGASAMARYSLEVGNARRNEQLHFEAVSRMRRGLGAPVGRRASGDEVVTAIDRVARSSATSREAISRYAETLQRGGLRGENLRIALQAAATRAAALGEESGQAFANMARGAGRSGVSIRRLADDVEARFGGIARRRLLSLEVISGKARENFDGIFGGLNLEPLLGAMHEIVGYFSQTHAIGQALRTTFSALFQPLVNDAGSSVPLVKRMIQGLVLTVQQFTISILSARLVARSMGTTLGAQISSGIATGVRVASGGPLGVIQWLGEQMGAKFRETLQIRSPSRVFAGYGRMIPAGVVAGIDDGSADVDRAVADMVSTPSGSSASAVASGSSSSRVSSSSSRAINIGTINVTGGGDAASIGASVRDALREILEGIAIEGGVPA